MKLKDFGEFSFINSIKNNSIFDNDSLIHGIGDDCAVYASTSEKDQLVTTDTMVEGVHFDFKIMRPYDIGFRLASANLSDIAAMGGTPKQCLISVAAPKDLEVKDLQGIYDGIKGNISKFGVNLIGGDTVATKGPLILTMTIIGEVEKGKAVLRSTAKAGDWIGVTNTLGGAAVGLDVLNQDVKGYFNSKDAFQRPVPQIELGNLIRTMGASSMNDISDGLANELNEISEASSMHLIVNKDEVPLHAETITWAEHEGIDPYEYAFYGGEDFQLIFTINEEGKKKLESHPLIKFIGRVEAKKIGVTIISDDQEYNLEPMGYDHFKES